ncbi:Tex family protein [Tepidimicrobium xylanilyticum]|uniref:Tex family protein n=1 Tax=Tepidimicrobium xylanilyticum TaxID=1123352 RepID=UPI00264F0D2B|nr:Tex family protein [Tepidimicrobium xylanilyticum]GMG95666.1 RNA-binding transcriptional accessory protein [Tepidimicrobium xylanilyticum]
MDIVKRLADEFQLKSFQVVNTINLIDEGNTIPFIARYRKEQTGNLKDTVLRDFYNRLNYLRNLKQRQEEVIRLIEEQGKLTEELKEEILKTETLQRVEDLYRPFRPKRRTRATIAKEKGLQGLADIILKKKLKEAELEEIVKSYISEEKGVLDEEEALKGAMDIIAEIISDNAEYREMIRKIAFDRGIIETKAIDAEQKSVFEMYYDYREPVKTIANHRILAINRGESKRILKATLILPDDDILFELESKIIIHKSSATESYLKASIEDSYRRLIFPSIEREVRNSLTERAEEEAIKIFALNLKPLLMQPPTKGKVVMGIDPAYRTGCKVAVIDETGKLLDYTTVYPTEPQNKVEEAKKELKVMIDKHNVDIIAIGNGTASRETELVVAEMIKEIDRNISYTIVNEAGASVYSASQTGQEEFPELDVSIRGAISIGRRLQDPLAELVKIEPKHIGVGQYQHDLNQTKLNQALEGVVEDCVNTVGVDLNTASASLLRYVSGISSNISLNIIKYREEKGRFRNREELLNVKGLGPKTFTQCAGFLRIPEGDNPLDNTAVHPESYPIAEKLLGKDINEKDIGFLSEELGVGPLTLKDIIEELKKPGRDPREELPKPIFRTDVLKVEDLSVDMVLTGTVRNVVDFGVFVDIGVKQDGLVHISQISNDFIRHPKEVVKVGDIVKVRILEVDVERGRISLSMKDV